MFHHELSGPKWPVSLQCLKLLTNIQVTLYNNIKRVCESCIYAGVIKFWGPPAPSYEEDGTSPALFYREDGAFPALFYQEDGASSVSIGPLLSIGSCGIRVRWWQSVTATISPWQKRRTLSTWSTEPCEAVLSIELWLFISYFTALGQIIAAAMHEFIYLPVASTNKTKYLVLCRQKVLLKKGKNNN